MATAKDSKSSALAKETQRRCQPMSKPKANKVSATVEAQPTAGITAAGKNQLSLAT